MAKEDKPLEYERRIFDTKGLAQRIDLEYLQKPNRFRDLRWKVTGLATVLAIAGVAPFLTGFGSTDRVFSNGPVARVHAIFEQKCQNCHSQTFSSVPDAACRSCHDGPAHPAKTTDTAKLKNEPRCGDCHAEHADAVSLSLVLDGHCTNCHANLTEHGDNVKLKNTKITAFRPGKHPEFGYAAFVDKRPLKFNHARHRPTPQDLQKTEWVRVRNRSPKASLPPRCSDCHAQDPQNLRGNLLAVEFEQHCRECHKYELEFDVYGVLGADPVPAPHIKDLDKIREFIAGAYRKAAAGDPGLVLKPLGRDFQPMPGADAWVARLVRESEDYLYGGKKCGKCHEYDGQRDGFPVIKKTYRVAGRYDAAREQGEPWLERGEFSHRAHRAVDCGSCHKVALSSEKTSDVLVPKMESCLPCHTQRGQVLSRCSQCHLYHNKEKEREKDKRPVEQLIGRRLAPPHVWEN
jgi:hypothetical protein